MDAKRRIGRLPRVAKRARNQVFALACRQRAAKSTLRQREQDRLGGGAPVGRRSASQESHLPWQRPDRSANLDALETDRGLGRFVRFLEVGREEPAQV